VVSFPACDCTHHLFHSIHHDVALDSGAAFLPFSSFPSWFASLFFAEFLLSDLETTLEAHDLRAVFLQLNISL
jgi:hypothetical protein